MKLSVSYPMFEICKASGTQDIITYTYEAVDPPAYPNIEIYPRTTNQHIRGLTVLVDDEGDLMDSHTKGDMALPTSALGSGGSCKCIAYWYSNHTLSLIYADLSPYGIIDMYSAMSPPCSSATDCFEDKYQADRIQPQYPNFDLCKKAHKFIFKKLN